jgi:hypothetical protein
MGASYGLSVVHLENPPTQLEDRIGSSPRLWARETGEPATKLVAAASHELRLHRPAYLVARGRHHVVGLAHTVSVTS